MAKSTFKWDRRGRNIFLEQATVKAVNKTAHDLMNRISDAKVVPYDTGNLQENVYVDKAHLNHKMASIVWDFKDPESGYIYAARLYYHPEFKFKNGRKGRWADDWIKGSKRKELIEMYEKNAKKVISK